MIEINKRLIERHLNDKLISEAWDLLENDEEVQNLIEMANIMAVNRLKYNDHGIVHARIVSGTALEIFELLKNRNIEFSSLKEGITKNESEIKLILLFASYLHDIGNAVHRTNHELIGSLLSKDIVKRLLEKLGIEKSRIIKLTTEIMHAIYATNIKTNALTTEASIVKIADSLDMSEGRARIPYKMGKLDVHSTSALSIKKVEIDNGDKPLKIVVHMNDYAGLFQIEELVIPKVKHSTLKDSVEIYLKIDEKTEQVYPNKHV